MKKVLSIPRIDPSNYDQACYQPLLVHYLAQQLPEYQIWSGDILMHDPESSKAFESAFEDLKNFSKKP